MKEKEGRRRKKAERGAKEKQAVEEMKEVMTRMRLNIEAPAETDTMAAAGTDTMAAAEVETNATTEAGQEAAADGKEKENERNWKDDVWWKHGGVKQSEYWNDPKLNQWSAMVSPVWCETRDIRQLRHGRTVWHMICTSEEDGDRDEKARCLVHLELRCTVTSVR